MEFYLEALDTQERLEGDNSPIGIIICRDKNKTVVEYALRTAICPIGVATYTVVPELPEACRADLPSPEIIAESFHFPDCQTPEHFLSDPESTPAEHINLLIQFPEQPDKWRTGCLRSQWRFYFVLQGQKKRLPLPPSIKLFDSWLAKSN